MPILDLEAFLKEQGDCSKLIIAPTAEDTWMLFMPAPAGGEAVPFCQVAWKDSPVPGYQQLVFTGVLGMFLKPEYTDKFTRDFAHMPGASLVRTKAEETPCAIAFECARMPCPDVLLAMVREGNPHAKKQMFEDWNLGFKASCIRIEQMTGLMEALLPPLH